eukprot:TRINITY_DN28660_c0_g1_i2.p1 TRINITY_DN28660_c0_g1~~TRINITY_DN28660_c0_g1_i2.p1  ORF type:complete len:697 (+),score=80.84 TRINITY_DN28660_c0_g1_i2:83-2173(+)
MASVLEPFKHAFCGTGHGSHGCPIVRLGPGVKDVNLDLHWLCRNSGSLISQDAERYICNHTRTPACRTICRDKVQSGEKGARLEDLQRYVNFILSDNPFWNVGIEQPWDVPQMDLSGEHAVVIVSQRQALYVALRMLALKIMYPASAVTRSNASFSTLNSLEYGLTYGCNWRPSVHPSPDPQACASHAPFTGVGLDGIQGNIFSILSWMRALFMENLNCFPLQISNASQWCSHDSVLVAVHGGRSGPDTIQSLDKPSFWRAHNRSLLEAGMLPNVCHFEQSLWVWNDSVNGFEGGLSTRHRYCVGFSSAPEIYGPTVEDFMSIDRPWTLAVDIAGAQYGGGCGSASGTTYATQDESTPVFYPETVALSFHSRGRTIGTGSTALLFLGVRRYFSGQSGSHGLDRLGLKTPLFESGARCGNLQDAQLLQPSRLLRDAVTIDATERPVQIFAHSLGVITSSCGTCAEGNLPNTSSKFQTAGRSCLVAWKDGRSGCSSSSKADWTYWKDVWIWIGALWTEFYPEAVQPFMRTIIRRVATGPWGAGVWWGNTLQYFVIVWLGTALLWQQNGGSGVALDYYAYGAPGQKWPPVGGFCEQYQAQGYEEVIRNLPAIAEALRGSDLSAVTLMTMYNALQTCSRCTEKCTFQGVGPPPSDIYCSTTCTADFLSCFVEYMKESGSLANRTPRNADAQQYDETVVSV